MRKILTSAIALACAAWLTSCASSSNTVSTISPANIAGTWEFVASSSSSAGTLTGVEVALTEGTVQVNGITQPDGNISAAGPNQILFVSLNTAPAVQFEGNCPGPSPSSLAGTVTNPGGAVNFTYSEGGNLFDVTAVLSNDGGTITGTYASQSGNPCTDSGTILGTKTPKLSGPYNGSFTLPDGTSATVTGIASESSGGTLTLTLTNTATSSNFSLAGPVMGNAFSVQGTYQGQLYTYYGYYEVPKFPTLYMANASNPSAPVYAGSLVAPPPQ
jgi:hypothetical protein